MKKLLTSSILTLVFTFSFGQFSFDSCLVSYYPFNANAQDESGFGNHGTVYGATLTQDRFGNVDAAYSFDGDDYITMLNPGPLGSTSRTISFWAQIDTTLGVLDTGETILAYGSTTLPNPGERYRIMVNRSCSGIGLETEESGYTKPTTVSDSMNWHHYAVVFDANVSGQVLAGTKIYLDGVLISDAPCFTYNPTALINTQNTHPLQLGRNIVAAYPRYFHGKLDDFRIYECALDSSEITTIYQFETSTASVGELMTTDHSVELYPNPSGDYFSVKSDLNVVKVNILNSAGQIVKQIDSEFSQINVSDLSKGIYFVSILVDGNNMITKKLIVD